MFSNKHTAREIVNVMNSVTMSMNDSLFKLKDDLTEDEYIEYRRAIGGVMAEIYIRLLQDIFKNYPDLSTDVENK